MPEATFKIQCPACKGTIRVPTASAGIKTNCPGCGQRIQIPRLKNETMLASIVEGPSRSTPPQLPAATMAQMAEEQPFDSLDATEGLPLVPHRGVLVMVLGIVSVSLATAGLFTFCHLLFLVFSIAGFVTGMLASVFGGADLRAMRRGRMDRSGEGQTKAGWVCGTVGLWVAAGTLIVLTAFVLFFTALLTR
jgi:hypothetical protein